MNVDDKRSPVSLDTVCKAIESERQYQVMRWGQRQNGVMVEVRHDIFDFYIYITEHLRQAIVAAATLPGNEPALESFRKVVALALAGLESEARSAGVNLNRTQVLVDAFNDARKPTDVSLSFYLLQVQDVVQRAAAYTCASSTLSEGLRSIVRIGVHVFMTYGVSFRVVDEVINKRDGQPV